MRDPGQSLAWPQVPLPPPVPPVLPPVVVDPPQPSAGSQHTQVPLSHCEATPPGQAAGWVLGSQVPLEPVPPVLVLVLDVPLQPSAGSQHTQVPPSHCEATPPGQAAGWVLGSQVVLPPLELDALLAVVVDDEPQPSAGSQHSHLPFSQLGAPPPGQAAGSDAALQVRESWSTSLP